jgi:PilZ domain
MCEPTKTLGVLVSSSFDSSTQSGPYREKRTVPRYEFIATVEVVEPVSDMRLSGRVSEISRKGCFVDILNTLPAGTKINLRITRDLGAFFTPATIIYVHDGMGMGIAFREPAADQMQILDAWLADLAQ